MDRPLRANVRGHKFLIHFIKELPCTESQTMPLFYKVMELNGERHSNLNTMMINDLCVAVYLNDALYVPYELKDEDGETLNSFISVAAEHFLEGDTYYSPEQLRIPFNKENEEVLRIHDHIVRYGFLLNTHPDLKSETGFGGYMTVGMRYAGLPEFVIYGEFKDCTSIINGVCTAVRDYFSEHPLKMGIYESGTILDNHQLELRSLDIEDEVVKGLAEFTNKYWKFHDYPIVQILLSDGENLLPHQEGYDHKACPQGLLPEKVLNA